MRVQRAVHPRAADELIAHPPHRGPRRREQRHRRPGPQQHADTHALRELPEQITQPHRLVIAREPEIRRHVPTRDVDARTCLRERLREQRQRLGPVD